MAIEPPHIPGLVDWRPLARGGFAVVWEARQETLDRLVAVKVDQRRLDVESERLRFLREAGAAGRMSGHPGIVTVHDAGILADDRPYLVMELCPGGSLTRYLSSDVRPTEQRVREIGVRIADALAATHARGVLHRDVKPANILVDAYDQVGLADFGLAAVPGPGDEAQETFRAVTPAYTAPEVLRRQPPSASGDVYSLAATLYALLAGTPPRWPDGRTPTLTEVLERQQQPLTPLPDADPGLMAVLERALSLDPDERPTAAEFRDRLAALPLAAAEPAGSSPSAVAAQADTGSTGSGVSTGGASAAGAGPRRRPVLVGLAVVMLLGLVGATVLLVNRGSGTVAAPAPAPTAATSTTGPDPSPSTAPPPSSDPTPSDPGASSSAPATPPARPAAVPAGFTDCAESLGEGGYCPATQECWAGVISVFDLPSLGTRQDCDETHVYQTFAAGTLDDDVRRQSQLEDDPRVRELCSADTLGTMLSARARQTDWEVLSLPPQEADGSDQVFRCLFGRGDRSRPVSLTVPR